MKKFLTGIFLLVAASFLGIGIFLGQNTQVLTKAVKICLECVGLG